MKPKTMILLVVAVGCGLGASYMTSRLLAERGNGPEEQEKIVILVAKKNLDTGMTIKDPKDIFVEKAVVKGEEPKSAVEKYDDLKGRVLKHSLREGDFVVATDLLTDKEAWISYILPKGYRAIGIAVTNVSTASGFACLPLSRVDIISTVNRGAKDSYARVLLQNVLVLAADTETRPAVDGKAAMPASVVTVALTPPELLKLELAKQQGIITLALRKFNDNQKVASTTYRPGNPQNRNSEDGDDGDAPPPPKPEPKPQPVQVVKAPAPKTHTHVMTVINDGGRQEQWEFVLSESNEVVSSRLLPRDTPRSADPPAPPSLANPPAPGGETTPTTPNVTPQQN